VYKKADGDRNKETNVQIELRNGDIGKQRQEDRERKWE
jgi:hypothetical protein